ncbi:MAG: hypothetical protein EZS28_040872 [Streblomastix strix]|uniref:non-specific serine/threonine protein kinase n=1 Tax=Streblomastix strix TaxID=222440 RepID=A0A5J4U0S5_9EUKA|nr:MAG: hypothetical protein EZS28_040872 [Streblomastix strix]
MLFKKTPFFKGKDDNDQLFKITQVLGTDELRRYCDKYQIQFEISGPLLNHRKKDWEDLKKTSDIYNSQGQAQPQKPGTNLDELITPDGLRLLTRLLMFDHDSRLSAKQTMEDEYFAEVRQYDIGPERSCGREELEIYRAEFLQARKDGIPFDGPSYGITNMMNSQQYTSSSSSSSSVDGQNPLLKFKNGVDLLLDGMDYLDFKELQMQYEEEQKQSLTSQLQHNQSWQATALDSKWSKEQDQEQFDDQDQKDAVDADSKMQLRNQHAEDEGEEREPSSQDEANKMRV